MKKSKRQTEGFFIENVFDPYRISDDDDMNKIYQRYLKDEKRVIEIDGLKYFKAMRIDKVNFDDTGLIAILPWDIDIKKNDVIIDENGNQYKYRGCEMMSFRGEIPEWYFNMVCAILSFPSEHIGIYFAVKKER